MWDAIVGGAQDVFWWYRDMGLPGRTASLAALLTLGGAAAVILYAASFVVLQFTERGRRESEMDKAYIALIAYGAMALVLLFLALFAVVKLLRWMWEA